ncbi:hypothetical protein ABZ807_05685 [Micromonospora sp. NPDC047548]|uniref:hypothetical protein n=1 Tax=Micromonospora sp. NPDC047548 TaxID=3155624 RepID=UPI0033EC11D0
MLTLCSLIMRALRRLIGRPAAPPPLDRTGPATVYPDRTGAWAPAAPSWNAPTQIYPRTGPLMTLAAQWRSSGRAWRL